MALSAIRLRSLPCRRLSYFPNSAISRKSGEIFTVNQDALIHNTWRSLSRNACARSLCMDTTNTRDEGIAATSRYERIGALTSESVESISDGLEGVRGEIAENVSSEGVKRLGGSVESVSKVVEDLGDSASVVRGDFVESEVVGNKTLRWVIGKVKGRLKVRYLPFEVKPHSAELEPLTFLLGTRKFHYKQVEVQKTRAKQFRSNSLTSSNFIRDEYDISTYGDPPTASLNSSKDDAVIFPEVSGGVSGGGAVVDYLCSEVGMTESDLNWYWNSAPSLLGIRVEEIRAEVEKMRKLGFTNIEIAKVLPSFPPCVEMDWQNVFEVFKVLSRDMGLRWNLVVCLMRKHPYIFTQDVSKVREAMLKLEELKLTPDNIAGILNHAPMLAFGPLTSSALDVLMRFMKVCRSTAGVSKMITHSLLMRPRQVPIDANTMLLASILHGYNADPQIVLKGLPQFYSQDGEKLLAILKVLSGKLLYLNPYDIAVLLEKSTANLCSITDEDGLRKHLTVLQNLFQHLSRARHAVNCNRTLINPDCQIETKISALINVGFTKEQAEQVLRNFPSLLTESIEKMILPRLRLLLAIPGVDSQFLVDNTRYLAEFSTQMIEHRVEFAARHKPDFVSAEGLKFIFSRSSQMFAEKCGVKEFCDVPCSTFFKTKVSRSKSEKNSTLVDNFNDQLMWCKDRTWFRSSAPSLLGITTEDIKKKRALLGKLGFPNIRYFVFVFPNCLDMDLEGVYAVFQVLFQEMGLEWKLLATLLIDHTYIFTQDSSKVREALTKLKALKLPLHQLDHIIRSDPMLLYMPLTSSAMVVMTTYLAAGGHSTGLHHMITHSLHMRPRQIPMDENTVLLTSLLHGYKADPQIVLKALPQFYHQDGEQLKMALNALSECPLSLTSVAIRSLLERSPALVCSISDEREFKEHLHALCELFKASKVREKLKEVPELVSPACQVQSNVNVLLNVGFSMIEVKNILFKSPSILTQNISEDELQSRLRLLLDIHGVNKIFLKKNPKYLYMKMGLLRNRVKFASNHKPTLVSVKGLEELLCEDDAEFAERCGCGLDVYYLEAGLEPTALCRTKWKRDNKREKVKSRNFKEVLSIINQTTNPDGADLESTTSIQPLRVGSSEGNNAPESSLMNWQSSDDHKDMRDVAGEYCPSHNHRMVTGSLEDSELELEEDEAEDYEEKWEDAEGMKELMNKLNGTAISKEDQALCWDEEDWDSLEDNHLLDNEDPFCNHTH